MTVSGPFLPYFSHRSHAELCMGLG